MHWTHEHTFIIATTPDRVYDALTYPMLLERWFAEEVEIDERLGGEYRFWGKHTLDPRAPGNATQQILAVEVDKRLSFSWPMGKVETVVDFLIGRTDEGTTALTVRHTVHGDLVWARPKDLIDDIWRLSIGNLTAMLEKSDALFRPDYDDPAPMVQRIITVEAPREEVFRTLVEPERINRWFGTDSAIVEPRIGGRYSVGWKYQVDGRDVTGGPTHIIDLVPNERLVLDWPDWRGDSSIAPQRIAFELNSEGEDTKLTFTHSGFERTADISDYPFGWSWYLGELRKAATTAA